MIDEQAPPVTELEAVIGLEVHAQILTQSKMFCRCSAAYAGAGPNTHVCAVCAGMPGALPVINASAVQQTVLTALALNCSVPRHSKFDRKNYTYPDLPKGYQITQYDQPIGQHGWVDVEVDGASERVGIVRVHLEEDTGKTVHTSRDGSDVSLVDYNRSGVPLMEIVSAPDIRSPQAARAYFALLRQILMYLGVNDGNLQEGSMRADVNVSLRAPGAPYGTQVEIKNLNSFRAVQGSLEYEIRRQAEVISRGGTVQRETRGWSEIDEVTLPQRSKEQAHDYRYFPEPDLPPLELNAAFVDEVRNRLPEMPAARRVRFERELGLPAAAARLLTEERERADFFESTLSAARSAPPPVIANWLLGDTLRLLNESGQSFSSVPLTPAALAELVDLVHSGTVSGAGGKELLSHLFVCDEQPEVAARRLNLLQIRDPAQLMSWVDQVLAANESLVENYRRGKTNVIQALVGKVRQASGGRADLQAVRALLEERLGVPQS